jgi:hypothetical protein
LVSILLNSTSCLSEKVKENFDDIRLRLISEIVEMLIEVLSPENASIDKITSRISLTPIQKIKQRQELHAVEIHIQKGRLEEIIRTRR